MFLFYPKHFLKFLVKSQPQRSYKKGSYITKQCILGNGIKTRLIYGCESPYCDIHITIFVSIDLNSHIICDYMYTL